LALVPRRRSQTTTIATTKATIAMTRATLVSEMRSPSIGPDGSSANLIDGPTGPTGPTGPVAERRGSLLRFASAVGGFVSVCLAT